MKWEADQRSGFFGWSPPRRKGEAPQPRFFAVVDLEAALASVGDIIDAWVATRAWPDAPPFSGGILDAWPARLTQGLAICREEFDAVMAYHRHQEVKAHG